MLNVISIQTKIVDTKQIPNLIDGLFDYKFKNVEGGRLTNKIYRFNFKFVRNGEYKTISQTQMFEPDYSVFTIENNDFGKKIIEILKQKFGGEEINF